jgi:hypothetical protein
MISLLSEINLKSKKLQGKLDGLRKDIAQQGSHTVNLEGTTKPSNQQITGHQNPEI